MHDTDDPYLREKLGLAVAERVCGEMTDDELAIKRWIEANIGRPIEPWQARRIARVLQIAEVPA